MMLLVSPCFRYIDNLSAHRNIRTTVAEKYKPFHDMTSNQAIVLGEMAKPAHQSIIPESIQAATKLAKEDGITNENLIAQLAVDFMVSSK